MVDVAADRKAIDIVLLDIRPVAFFADYFVLLTGTSERHMQALLEGFTEALDSEGMRPSHVEGTASTGWVLVDCGDVVIHVFSPAVRDYYRLERVWSEAITLLRMQ